MLTEVRHKLFLAFIMVCRWKLPWVCSLRSDKWNVLYCIWQSSGLSYCTLYENHDPLSPKRYSFPSHEVCEILCFLGPKIDPAKVSLVKSAFFTSKLCSSAFSLKSLCSISCIYSCSWHTGSVLWACGMSSCFCLWIGSYHKNAHFPIILLNTSKSMSKVMTSCPVLICQEICLFFCFL